MKLRNFLIAAVSLLAVMWPQTAEACADLPQPQSQYYTFFYMTPLGFRPDGESAGNKETVDFWYGYCNGKVTRGAIETWLNSDNPAAALTGNRPGKFISCLRKRNDRAALKLLSQCVELNKLISAYDSELWEYEKPSVTGFRRLADAVQVSPAGALRPRQLFLKMRALYRAEDYRAVVALWEKDCAGMEQSPLRDRFEGYLAGAYYRLKDYSRALEIFYRLGDNVSAEWCVSKLVGLGNLEKAVAGNPQSDATLYLLQDYVNYLTGGINHSLEKYEGYEKYFYDGPTLPDTGECASFIALADEVLARGKVKDPMAWASAKAVVLGVEGKSAEARQALAQARLLDGTEAMRRNLERVDMLINLYDPSQAAQERFIAQLKELVARANAEMKAEGKVNKETYSDGTSYEWITYDTTGADDHIFLTDCILPRLNAMTSAPGREVTHYLMCAMSENLVNAPWMYQKGYAIVDNLEACLALADMVRSGSATGLDKAFMDLAGLPQALTDDMAGTALLRAGKYEEALKYLDAVPLTFIAQQNIFPYLVGRKVSTRNPFNRQYYKTPKESALPKVARVNYKADFARRVLALEQEIADSEGEQRARKQYDLALLLFNASHWGDLWALTSYSFSVYDYDEDPTAQRAQELLEQVAQNSTDPCLRAEAGYGLLAIPRYQQQTHREDGYTWNSWERILTGEQRNALKCIQATTGLPRYIRTCDALKDYM